MSECMKKWITGIQHLLLIGGMLVVSCGKFEYTDQLQKLGARVEILEQKELKVNEQIETLRQVVTAVEQNGYITQAKTNPDGSLTLTFNNGETVTLPQGVDGKDGRDGEEATLNLGVDEGPDGKLYWMLNGKWLTDDEGQMVLAGAIDGKDGVDGKDGHDGHDGKSASMAGAYVPQTRINPDTRNWEISVDGGKTWQDTGCCADGKDGQNGKDGADGKDGVDGADDIFITVTQASDGMSITFTLVDGRTFTIPII